MTIAPPAQDREALLAAASRLRAEVQRSIVGQEAVLDEILMSLIAGGHALLVGVPGLAKTLMVRSLADAVHLDFRRIQFTPDLVPSDIRISSRTCSCPTMRRCTSARRRDAAPTSWSRFCAGGAIVMRERS